MKAKLFVLCLVLIGLVLASGCAKKEAGVAPTAPTMPTGTYLTAKQALAIAQKEVPSDAYPYIIRHKGAVIWTARSDGSCERWVVEFYNPAGDRRYEVDVIKGQAKTPFEGTAPSTPPDRLPNGWMDSSNIAKLDIVKSKCAGAPADEYFFGIYAGYAGARSSWTVGCGETGNQITMQIDVVTGELIETRLP